jgi:tRNA dimethylallyltransferase
MYIKSLIEGIFEIPSINPEIKNRLLDILADKGLPCLYEKLKYIDPNHAGKIKANDTQRILRALEVWEATGKTMSEHWKMQSQKSIYKIYNIYIDCPRDLLYSRINLRMDKMLTDGLIDEIDKLLSMGYSFSDYGFNSVGYKEFKKFYDKENDLNSCLELAKQHSRNYAKRQYTWYKNCKFNIAISQNNINLSEIKARIQSFLAT